MTYNRHTRFHFFYGKLGSYERETIIHNVHYYVLSDDRLGIKRRPRQSARPRVSDDHDDGFSGHARRARQHAHRSYRSENEKDDEKRMGIYFAFDVTRSHFAPLFSRERARFNRGV